MKQILFVCRGNVGRSQMAEALFNKKAIDKSLAVRAISAGTKLSGPEQPIGELSPGIDIVVDAMQEVGIDVRHNLRQSVTEEMVQNVDSVILVVDERDPIPDYLQNNPKVKATWDVLDPKGQTLDFTRDVRNQIEVLVDKLIDELSINFDKDQKSDI